MLPENLLEELVRGTAFSRHLVQLAWRDLSTETRLQVIHAAQGSSAARDTPAWLVQLALEDSAAIVRYWAARGAYFRNEGPEKYAEQFKALAATDEDKAAYTKVASDTCELVRMCLERRNTLDYSHLTAASPLERLHFIRQLDFPGLEPFINWLTVAVAAGVPDSELATCAREFFRLPKVISDMNRKDYELTDGYEAYQCGEGMKKGWALTRVAGQALGVVLTFALPTSYGLATMTAEELAELPDFVVKSFIGRPGPPKEVVELIELMQQHPERFPASVIEDLRRHDEYYEPTVTRVEMDEHRRRHATDRQEATLDTVLELKQQLGELQQFIEEAVSAAANRKRGLFG